MYVHQEIYYAYDVYILYMQCIKYSKPLVSKESQTTCFLLLVNACTPQPLYNTIVGVQANFRVDYPIRVIMRVKCIDI